jgi:predicted DNA-binding antitoxin AbrB/MazE fold protein
MTVKILAVYEQGQLRLLEPVELHEGQPVSVTIDQITADDAIRAALGDLVHWPDPSDDRDAAVEAEAEEIRRAFSVGRPLSEIILEDR